ncbi:sugar ABC transporter permease [Aquibacillus koreensis]|uniref:Sugar ABC transporter permease n=1 Tax=Aquibacillus koreensis TaxID=279446 RepID=A0A9X3WK27_9BACI|nr:sugar ABC transporter permease [Aquibacillus koreensis]MCT2536717.1 sugar ABC transporter permease [Aquibacillus koreensis]MDC3421527.1 sugar ABC transporter permease [Aquibacillus koreensis]
MRQNKKLKNIGIFLLFGGPTLIIFSAVIVIPFIFGLYLTFTNWSVATGDSTFVGLSNYFEVFTDKDFLTSFWFTIKYVIACLIFANLIAFFIALALTSKINGQGLLRTGFFTPNLIGGIVLGYLWQTLFSQVLPYLGDQYGWGIFEKSWLGDPDKAFWALVVASVWQLVGYLVIIYMAGFASVPKEVIEASSIDGANYFQILRKIILPLTIPSIIICFFLTITRAFLAYDINLSLTDGGPYNSTEMVSYHIVQKAFLSNDYGAGQAQAIVLFMAVALIAITQTYILKKREVEA